MEKQKAALRGEEKEDSRAERKGEASVVLKVPLMVERTAAMMDFH